MLTHKLTTSEKPEFQGLSCAKMLHGLMLIKMARNNGNLLTPSQAAEKLGLNPSVKAAFNLYVDGEMYHKKSYSSDVEKALVTSHNTLSNPQFFFSDFLAHLHSKTVFGRIGNFANAPFNSKVSGHNAGSLVTWTDEGAKKATANPIFDVIEMKEHKLAAIVVYTQELARRTDGAISELIRNDLTAAIGKAIDAAFLSDAAETDFKPAGILNGAQKFVSSGVASANVKADLLKLVNYFFDHHLTTLDAAFLISERLAMQLALTDSELFGSILDPINPRLLGIPVITSQAVGNQIVLLQPQEIYVAQDGGVDFAVVDQASIMNDKQRVDLFQQDMFAIRAEKFITWRKRRPVAATVLTFA